MPSEDIDALFEAVAAPPRPKKAARKPRAAAAACSTVVLDANLNTLAAAPLAQALLALRGGPVSVDASAVERLGGQCLQVLLSAHASWLADGHALSLVNPSDGFDAALGTFGAAGSFTSSPA